jgi:MFS family permease
MTTESLTMRGPVHGTPDVTRVAWGSTAGAVIEAYDFIGFGTAAALYFGTAFFPSEDPMIGTLSAFATLGVGFVARPLGGILGGHLGDKIGRKPVLVASLIVMGLATFVIGLLPTYASVGLLAPTLLVIVRIIQGLAYGAEWGGAILMTYEHAPWTQKGRYTGIVQAGFPIGLLLANLVFLISVHLPGDWAWRVPFLASALLVIIGLVIRDDWRNILRGIFLRVAETAGYAVAITYMISYLKEEQLATPSQTITALCIASAIGIFATMFWARLADRIGRKPLYVAVCTFNAAWAIPMFLLANLGLFAGVVFVMAISYCISQNALAGVQGTWFPELFQAKTRSSGASLAYQISAMISGLTPFVTTLLYIEFTWVGPAVLFLVYSLLGLGAALVTRETWGSRERQEAAAAAASTPRPAHA